MDDFDLKLGDLMLFRERITLIRDNIVLARETARSDPSRSNLIQYGRGINSLSLELRHRLVVFPKLMDEVPGKVMEALSLEELEAYEREVLDYCQSVGFQFPEKDEVSA